MNNDGDYIGECRDVWGLYEMLKSMISTHTHTYVYIYIYERINIHVLALGFPEVGLLIPKLGVLNPAPSLTTVYIRAA